MQDIFISIFAIFTHITTNKVLGGAGDIIEGVECIRKTINFMIQ